MRTTLDPPPQRSQQETATLDGWRVNQISKTAVGLWSIVAGKTPEHVHLNFQATCSSPLSLQQMEWCQRPLKPT